MKRRNVDSIKTRRPVKKIPKIYDGFYTGLVVYVKLILLWICVMGGDFLLEFRLEYLYPIYLLLHNTYEAYKFQGVAFALLLGCVVVSVDVICLGVVPVQWLYLLGSLAVWSHISWNLAPLGPLILLPTLIYIDGKSIRPLPTQTLSPLAAHCVGFPLVSLGFGLKSFIASRLKQRTRNDVARQNELLYSLLWDSLPFTSPSPMANTEVIPNGGTANGIKKPPPNLPIRRKSVELEETIQKPLSLSPLNNNSHLPPIANGGLTSTTPPISSSAAPILNGSTNHVFVTQNNNLSCNFNTPNNNNSNSLSSLPSSTASIGTNSSSPVIVTSSTTPPMTLIPNQCSCMLAPKNFKLESEVRKLRSDLHVVRTTESELRNQISTLLGLERNLRADIAALQGEHESLQLKYSALSSKSQEERQSYEKKLLDERKAKENAINKQKKVSQECCGDCKRKLRDAEREKETLRRDLKLGEEKMVRVERELQNVKSTLLHEQKNKEACQQPSAETARLMSLLTALQDQNAHLESSLSAETRLKLDLFSALGEARRQLSIRDSMIKAKEEELEDVRGQLIEILTVTDFTNHHPAQNHSPILQLSQVQQQPSQQPNHHHQFSHHNRLNSLKQNHMSTVGPGSLPSPIGSLSLGVSVSCHSNHMDSRGGGLISNGPTTPLLQSPSVLGGITPQQQPVPHGGGSGGGHSLMHPGNENLNFSMIES